MRTTGLGFLALSGALLVAACGQQAPTVTAAERQASPVDAALLAADFAPTGTLRAVFLGANPVHGRIDQATGRAVGPVADLVEELSRRLGVPFTLQPCTDARCVIDAVNAQAADVGFLAFEEARAAEVQYAGAYALMHSSYLLPAGSPLRSSAEADSAGVTIGTVRARSQQIYLSGNLVSAELVVYDAMPSNEELERLLVGGALDAFGINRQNSLDIARAFPSLRVMEDSFFSVPQEFVVLNGQTAKVNALLAFTDELRESGFLQASLEKAGLLGAVGVAPRIVH